MNIFDKQYTTKKMKMKPTAIIFFGTNAAKNEKLLEQRKTIKLRKEKKK